MLHIFAPFYFSSTSIIFHFGIIALKWAYHMIADISNYTSIFKSNLKIQYGGKVLLSDIMKDVANLL